MNHCLRISLLLLAGILAASLVFCCPANLWALGGELDSPSVAYPSAIDASRKKKIDRLHDYMRDDLRFLEGSFLNQFTHQRFGGDAAQVSGFIERLHDVAQWRIYIQFRDFGEKESAFSMDQDTAEGYIRLIVNSARDDFTLRDFRQWLPTPRLPKSNREKGAVREE